MANEIPEGPGRSEARKGPDDRESADYVDSDVPTDDVDPGEGSYTDSDVRPERRSGPDDDGEYTDKDVVSGHRAEPAAGSYTDSDVTTTAAPTAEETQDG